MHQTVTTHARPLVPSCFFSPFFCRLIMQVVNMSASALKDLNISQSAELEKGKDSSVKSCTNRLVANGNKSVNKEENAPPACTDAVTNGNKAAIVDVEYIDSENLIDLPDVDATLSVCR
jgi:hypothetical protein